MSPKPYIKLVDRPDINTLGDGELIRIAKGSCNHPRFLEARQSLKARGYRFIGDRVELGGFAAQAALREDQMTTKQQAGKPRGFRQGEFPREYRQDFGDRLKTLRRSKAITQALLGTLLGVSDKLVSAIESGHSLTKRQADAICRRWPDWETWLMTGNGEPPAPAPERYKPTEPQSAGHQDGPHTKRERAERLLSGPSTPKSDAPAAGKRGILHAEGSSLAGSNISLSITVTGATLSDLRRFVRAFEVCEASDG